MRVLLPDLKSLGKARFSLRDRNEGREKVSLRKARGGLENNRILVFT
jgi:hypothetical protein